MQKRRKLNQVLGTRTGHVREGQIKALQIAKWTWL